MSAWIVTIEPSWPVLIAVQTSAISAPRDSPSRMRSGRNRSAARTSSRMVTPASVRRIAGTVQRLTHSGTQGRGRRRPVRGSVGPSPRSASRCSSALSSMTTTVSRPGIMPASTRISVVLPVAVPPAMSTLARPSTQAARKAATPGGMTACRT